MPELISVVMFFLIIIVMVNMSYSRKLSHVNTLQQVSSPIVDVSLSLAGPTNIDIEEGYVVETVLDGNKMNISVYSAAIHPSQDYLYALDSSASQLLKIRLPIDQSDKELSRIVVGDWSGTSGYRDGVGEMALLDHPKGLTVDKSGNIYVADVRNRAIRKISPTGYVTTIAGQSNKTGYADGEGKDALLSADFDLTYLPGTCSLLISDRGNRRLRMIQVKSPQECSSEEAALSGGNYHLESILGVIFGVTGTVFGFWILLFQKWEVQRKFPALLAILGGNSRGNAELIDNSDDSANDSTHRGQIIQYNDLIDVSDHSANGLEHLGQNRLQPARIAEAGMRNKMPYNYAKNRALTDVSDVPANAQNSQEGSGIGRMGDLDESQQFTIKYGKNSSLKGQSSGDGPRRKEDGSGFGESGTSASSPILKMNDKPCTNFPSNALSTNGFQYDADILSESRVLYNSPADSIPESSLATNLEIVPFPLDVDSLIEKQVEQFAKGEELARRHDYVEVQ